jgi:hypothetical protein
VLRKLKEEDGARHARLMRHFMTEGLLLACGGGAVGESHSETGMTHPYWAGSQMPRDPGSVTFTPDQARRIRVNIKAKMQKKSV